MSKKYNKLEITIDTRELFQKNTRNSRIVTMSFTLKDNKIMAKFNKTQIEVGIMEQIRISEYLQDSQIRDSKKVYSKLKDCWKCTFMDSSQFDRDIYHVYDTIASISVNDFSLILGYLKINEQTSFYNVSLLDYSELPEELMKEYEEGKDHEFIIIENKYIYPECEYKISLEKTTAKSTSASN
jgi:hypothetical protein